ncbi:MAG: pimeloyl-CoA dehydrogenase small subunit [Hyphomicrobiales bacterium]|nr:MAG: pimeloyl-CoA dehydrogenase small subunit [Hyphomicrobiales bacterium]
MTAHLDPETRALLGDGLRRIGVEHGFESRRRQKQADGHALWRALGDLGVTALGLPTSVGGLDAGITDQDLVMSAIGRDLLIAPFLSTSVLCAPLLTACATHEQTARWLEADGRSAMLALAHAEPQLGYARFPVATQAIAAEGAFVLSGTKQAVLDAPFADTLLVTATLPDGMLGLFALKAGSSGLSLDAYHTLDGQPAGHVTLDKARAELVSAGDVSALLEDALDRAVIATCAEALGAMEAVVALCHSYLKTRRAFGRNLSQFQVLQHRFVDLHIALEETRAIVDTAEAAHDSGAPDRAAVAVACKITTGRNGRLIAEQGVHLHGGIGMTDDFIISHYFKRLMMTEARFGGVAHHLDRYVALVEPAPASEAAA